MVSRPQEVSTDSEEILHDTVNRREPLELTGRLETPSPSSSTARHRYCRRPWIVTNTSSRCQVSPLRPRRRRSRRA